MKTIMTIKKPHENMKTTSVLFIILSVFLFASSGCGKKNENAQTSVEVQPANIAVGLGKIIPQGGVSSLASPIAGIVSEISVSTGDTVKAGDLLLTLDNTDATLALNEINSRIATQQKSVQSAKLLAEQSRISVQEKERKLSDARELLAAGAVTGESVRNLQNELDVEKQSLKKLQNDITVQESQLRELASQKSIRSQEVNRTNLRAPMNGVVLDVLPRKGEAVNRYETYVMFAPDAPLVVLAEVDEMFSNSLQIGQKCEVKAIGSTHPAITGEIITISPDLKSKSIFSDNGQDLQDRRVREIEISLENSVSMLIDTKVECIIHLK